ncbi:MAG: glycosyltransferase family 1 protein [Chloroflexi bacterium]|nr:glycosyltransferase family 1 protein [Chloroflexota bacterium]
MQICMLSVHTCPLAALGGKKTGGMNVYVRDLAIEFARRGHFVEVFTRSQDACAPRVSHELGPNCRVVHIPAGPETPLSTDEVYDYLDQFTAGVLGYARRHGRSYEVIHSHYWLSGLVARKLRAVWGAPIVQMFHTLGRMKNEVYEFTGELASETRIRAEAEIMAFSDAIVAASPLEKSQMVIQYGASPQRIAIIPLAVDHRRFRPIPQDEAKAHIGLPTDKRLVLYVGRIEPLKGVDTLLLAMRRVFEAWPRCRKRLCLAIIGGDVKAPREQLSKEMIRLQDLSRELGMAHLTAFLGRRNQDALPDYYSAADVVVIPSHYESFGLVALEAMSCGTPVIASRVGGLTFTVVEGVTGYQVPNGDDQAMADRILRVLQDDELRRRLGEQALELAACYRWPDVAARLERLFRAVMEGKKQEKVALSA